MQARNLKHAFDYLAMLISGYTHTQKKRTKNQKTTKPQKTYVEEVRVFPKHSPPEKQWDTVLEQQERYLHAAIDCIAFKWG